MELQRNKLTAALTPIAFFRAINGSYDLDDIRYLTYKELLTDEEWQAFIALYHDQLGEEKNRNEKQKTKHQQFKVQLAEKIDHLRSIVDSIPEITDIFLVNSYALGALKETSDIDLLVITRPDTMWWTRLKLTAALEWAGIRRKPGHIEEQFCLSFFINDNAMDMSQIALDDDLYLHFWTPAVKSLLGRSLPSWHEQNSWLKSIFPSFPIPNSPEGAPLGQFPIPNSPSLTPRFLNALVRPILKWRHKNRSQKLGPEASIVVSDTMFKFHNQDRRQYYKAQTQLELRKLLSMID